MKTALGLIFFFFSIIALEGVALACSKESGFEEVSARRLCPIRLGREQYVPLYNTHYRYIFVFISIKCLYLWVYI